jgi:pimeloyl-ACP methyl ester carboxylesterase
MSIDTFTAAQQRMLIRYGVKADSHFVDTPVVGGKAHILVSGEGPPVVMLNGIGTPGAMWAPLMAHLPGFRLHAVDLPGFGATDAGPRLVDAYRPSAVQFLEQTLDGLDLDRAFFVANSLGSLWTMWLAVERSHRVAAMIHVGCPALILGTSAPLPMRMLSVPLLSSVMMKMQPPSPRQVAQLSKMVRQHPLVPELAELLLATERLPGFESAFRSALRMLVRFRGARPAMALSGHQLSQITQPTQLIWGRNDPMGAPSVGKRAAELIPDCELHTVQGGHTPWLTQAKRIGALGAAFLTRNREALRE